MLNNLDKEPNFPIFALKVLEKLCSELSIQCFIYILNNETRRLEMAIKKSKSILSISFLLTNVGMYVLYDRQLSTHRYPYLLETVPSNNSLHYLPQWVKLSQDNSYTLIPEFHTTFSKPMRKNERNSRIALISLLCEGLIHTKDFLAKRKKQKIPFNTFLKRLFKVIDKSSLREEENTLLSDLFIKLEPITKNHTSEERKRNEISKESKIDNTINHTQASRKAPQGKSQGNSPLIVVENQNVNTISESKMQKDQVMKGEKKARKNASSIFKAQLEDAQALTHEVEFKGKLIKKFNHDLHSPQKAMQFSNSRANLEDNPPSLHVKQSEETQTTEKLQISKLYKGPISSISIGQPISNSKKQATKPILSDNDCVFCERKFQLAKPIVLECKHNAHAKCLKK